MIGAVSPRGVDREQHVVPEELGGDHRSDAVASVAVRNHGRDKLFGSKCQRRGPVVDRRLHGYAAQRTFCDSGRHGARQRNAVAKELGREAIVGLPVDILRSADLGETAVPHDRDLVGDRQRLLLVVGHQQRRHSGVGEQPCDRLAGGCPQPGVQRAERLVEQHQHGLAGQRASERDALLLTAGQLMRAARRV